MSEPESGSGPEFEADSEFESGSDSGLTAESNGIVATYVETATERRLVFEAASTAARKPVTVAQNLDGYAMLSVRTAPEGDEIERYYGLDMALDHAAELLGASPDSLPVPEAAADMGM